MKGDESGIVELIKQELNPEYDLGVWEYKYKKNPTHIFPNAWVAEADGKIIAHHAINPAIMKCMGKYTLVSQSIEVATHKEYQRQGIFKTIARKVSDETGKMGIPISYVFPNPRSYPGFIKIGWEHIFPFVVLAKVLNPGAVSTKYSNNMVVSKAMEIALKVHTIFLKLKPIPTTKNIIISDIHFFDESFDELWTNVSKYYDYVIQRNSEYLNWRYSHPREDFKIYTARKNNNMIGYVILNCKSLPDINAGYIYDLFCNPNDVDTIKHLISKSIEYFIDKKMDIIQICVLKNHPYYRICKKYGFLKRSEKPFLFHINDPSFDIPIEDFRDYKRWFLSFGDLYHD